MKRGTCVAMLYKQVAYKSQVDRVLGDLACHREDRQREAGDMAKYKVEECIPLRPLRIVRRVRQRLR